MGSRIITVGSGCPDGRWKSGKTRGLHGVWSGQGKGWPRKGGLARFPSMAKLRKMSLRKREAQALERAAACDSSRAARASRVRQGRVLVNSTSSMVANWSPWRSNWFTPFLVHRLGVEVYGVVPLTLLVISYFALVTNSINVFVGRDFRRPLLGGRPFARRTDLRLRVSKPGAGGRVHGGGLGHGPFAATIFHVPTGLERAAQGLFAATAVGFS